MTLPLSSLTASEFSGNIILPNNDGWTEATQAWGAQFKQRPKAALQPKTAEDVSKAILWLNKFGLNFAVRSGGIGQSQSDDVIIDLCFLNKAEYNAEENCFHLGPGQSWHDLYKKLASGPLTVIGGRVGLVGVGGFTLGGGFSYLSNLYGLASDSILDAEVILADGSIVRAGDNEDLLFAIRGAGHAFGVVTELVVRAYPKPKIVFGGLLLFSLDKFSEISRNIAEIAANNRDPNVNAMVAVARTPPNMQHVIIVMPLVFGSPEYAKDALAWAWKIGPFQDLSGAMTYEEALAAQDMLIQRPTTTTTFQLNSITLTHLTPAVMQAALDWQVKLHKNPRFYGASLLIEPYFPGAFLSDDKGNAWPHPTTLHIIEMLIQAHDTQPGYAEEEAEYLRDCFRDMEKVAEPGTVLPKYPNYALSGTPAMEFYGANLARLQEIKKRLDPKNRFDNGIRIA